MIHATQSLLCLGCLLSKASTLTLSFSLQGCHWPLPFPVPIWPIASKLSHWAPWIPTLRLPRRALMELLGDVSTLLPPLLALTTVGEQTLQGKFAPASPILLSLSILPLTSSRYHSHLQLIHRWLLLTQTSAIKSIVSTCFNCATIHRQTLLDRPILLKSADLVFCSRYRYSTLLKSFFFSHNFPVPCLYELKAQAIL